jgi:hypothetical protein
VALLELAMISTVSLTWNALACGYRARGRRAGVRCSRPLIGAVTRDVRAASLLAFMIAPPFAFLGFISAGEVSTGPTT